MLVTATVPAPALVAVPSTVIRSLEGNAALSTSMDSVTPTARARLLLKVRLPMEAPGDTVPPAVAFPTTVPLPLIVWLEPSTKPPDFADASKVAPVCTSKTALLEIEPLAPSFSGPPLIVVLPLYVLLAFKTSVPTFVLLRPPAPLITPFAVQVCGTPVPVA